MRHSHSRRTVKCWRCDLRFPEGTSVKKVNGVPYTDKYENVRNHWIEVHERESRAVSI